MAAPPHEQRPHGDAVLVVHEKLGRLRPHPETSHTEHGLTYLVDGWFRMDHGQPLEVQSGTVTIVPAGVPHQPLDGRDMDYWLLGFCASCLGLDESQPLMSPFRRVRHGAMPVVALSKARRRRVARLYRELRDECELDAPESPELVRSLLLLLLAEVRRAMPGGDAAIVGGSLVAEALEFIQRHGLEPISLKDVAAAVCRTPAHVATTVKAATGHSVGQWISSARVAEAAARLAHSDDSLDDIAQHVGWRDKTHFIRQFRKAHGITPAAWRRAHRGRHRG
jgi:AraC-like DNA-binding protein